MIGNEISRKARIFFICGNGSIEIINLRFYQQLVKRCLKFRPHLLTVFHTLKLPPT